MVDAKTQGACRPSRATSVSRVPADPAGPDRSNPLGQIARLLRDNDLLFAELSATLRRLRQAREYLRDEDSSPELGLVLLGRLRRRRLVLMERLRANRIEANRLLGLPAWDDLARV